MSPDEVDWPPYYIDHDGHLHGWDDLVPGDPDSEPGPAITYRELAYDEAAAGHMDIDAFLAGMQVDENDEDDEDYW